MKIFILAGEASGDQLGARLVADIKRLNPSAEIYGVGGDALAAQGMQSIFPMQDLSLIGIAEVLPKIPLLLRRLSDAVKAIHEIKPDVVLTIDVPDFSKRLARRLQPLRRLGQIKLVHYVAPTVWAWRPGRAKTMARLFDHLLCLFPFEPPYFEAVGLPATFAGHPIAMNPPSGVAGRLREKLGITESAPVVCLLPGSRRGEVQKLLPVFMEAFDLLKQQQSNLVGIIPTLKNLKPLIENFLLPAGRRWHAEGGLFVLADPQDKHDAFALAAAQGGAIAASGTVSLELAVAGCPHIVAYKLHPITYWLARALIKIPYMNLVNILAGRTVVWELLQNAATPCRMVSSFQDCIQNSAREKLAFAEQLAKLKSPAPDTAARVILQLANGL